MNLWLPLLLGGSALLVGLVAAKARRMPSAEERDMIGKLGARPSIVPTFRKLTPGEAEALIQGGLVGLNLYQIQRGIPGISAGIERGEVIYRQRDDREEFRSIRDMRSDRDAQGRMWGDCEDLAAAVAAERTHAGYPSAVVLRETGPGYSHAVVQDLGTGKILDPSRDAGMP